MVHTQKNKVNSFFALFLAAMLLSTFFIKTIHVLFVHHGISEITPTHSDRTAYSNPYNNDCPICDFEFCYFVSTNQVEIQKAPEFFADNITPRKYQRVASKASHNFQLRAPPVL